MFSANHDRAAAAVRFLRVREYRASEWIVLASADVFRALYSPESHCERERERDAARAAGATREHHTDARTHLSFMPIIWDQRLRHNALVLQLHFLVLNIAQCSRNPIAAGATASVDVVG